MKRNSIKVKNIGFIIAIVCLLVAIGIFAISYYEKNFAVDSVIDIDVNPSIEIKANKNDKVIDVSAINNDGVDILDGMNLKESNLKVAVNAIIG